MNIELVDAEDNRHIWGQQENHKLANLFTVQEDIAKEITDNLQLKLTSGEKERLAKRHTENAEAYQLYLKGRYYYNRRTGEGVKRAYEYFERAIQKDPNYALVWAGLADTTPGMGWLDLCGLRGTIATHCASSFLRARLPDAN